METINLIPAWFVAMNLLFAGFMWLVTRNMLIRMDSRIWGYTKILVGILYLLSYLNTNPESVSMEYRLNATRVIISLMSFSQWFPLLVSYIRELNNKRMVNDGNKLVGSNNHINRDS